MEALGVDVRLADGGAVDQALKVLFHRPQGRPAAVRDAGCDDDRVPLADLRAWEFAIENIESKLDRLQNVGSPVALGVLPGKGVLEGEAVGVGGVILGALLRRQRGDE